MDRQSIDRYYTPVLVDILKNMSLLHFGYKSHNSLQMNNGFLFYHLQSLEKKDTRELQDCGSGSMAQFLGSAFIAK